MISSKELLRVYALNQAHDVSASVSTMLPTSNDSSAMVRVESNDEMGIVNTIRKMNLAVDIYNPHDPVFSWNGVYNSKGYALFWGHKKFYLVNSKGGYSLPSGYGDIPLELSDYVPIDIEGAVSAFVAYKDENGQVSYTDSLSVQNNQLMFPWRLAGKDVILGVLIDLGSGRDWMYWNVATGGVLKDEHFPMSLKPSIKGIQSVFTDKVEIMIPTKGGIGTNITAELHVTKAQKQTVTFYTSEGRWFVGAWILPKGSDKMDPYGVDKISVNGVPYMGFNVILDPGTYYIIPVWNKGDLVEPREEWVPPTEVDGGLGAEN